MSDFTLTSDDVIEEAPEFNTAISRFENNVEQRRAIVSTPVRKFRLLYRNRSQSDFETVRNFFVAKYGRYTSFTWTNPNDSTEYTVRFDHDELIFARVAYQRFDFEIIFRQVI